MKKLLSSILVVVLALTLFGVTAFAAGSASDVVEVTNAGSETDESGEAVAITTSETTIPWLTEAEAAPIIGGVTADQLQVIWQKDVHAAPLPVTLAFNINGYDGKTAYVFHWDGSAWQLVATGTAPTVTATFSDLSPVAVVIQKAASNGSSSGSSTSPATGQPVGLYLSFGIMAAALCGAYAVSKKRA